MKRYGFDTRNPDFIWNKNRLVLEKEAIKSSLGALVDTQIIFHRLLTFLCQIRGNNDRNGQGLYSIMWTGSPVRYR